MNTVERQRPIRLTFSGEVESYDWQVAQWIRDLSRDPRELIPLSYPPAADAYLYLQKTTCANAIAHQLKYAKDQQLANIGTAALEGGGWVNAWFALQETGWRAGIDVQKEAFFFNPLFLNSAEFFTSITDPETTFSTTFWDKVVCHMWCHMSDDCTFTYENWLALIQAIFDDSTLGDAQQWLKLMVILLGRKGLTNLGFLKVNDSDVLDPATDCVCV